MQIEAEAILFDNDGVLVDSHAQTEEAWRTLAAEFGIDVEPLLVELVGRRAADTLSQHLSGPDLDAAVSRLEDLEVGLANLTEPGIGAIDLLRQLPTGRWTVVTSAARRLAMARWHGAQIPIPPITVTAEDVTRGKPDPLPFLVGAERLGVDPTRCLVFEDSPSGGEAARAAGAMVIAVGEQPWDLEPTARIRDLGQLTVTTTDVEDGAGLRLAIADDAN